MRRMGRSERFLRRSEAKVVEWGGVGWCGGLRASASPDGEGGPPATRASDPFRVGWGEPPPVADIELSVESSGFRVVTTHFCILSRSCKSITTGRKVFHQYGAAASF